MKGNVTSEQVILSYASGWEGYVERRKYWACITILMVFIVCYNNDNNGDYKSLNIVTTILTRQTIIHHFKTLKIINYVLFKIRFPNF